MPCASFLHRPPGAGGKRDSEQQRGATRHTRAVPSRSAPSNHVARHGDITRAHGDDAAMSRRYNAKELLAIVPLLRNTPREAFTAFAQARRRCAISRDDAPRDFAQRRVMRRAISHRLTRRATSRDALRDIARRRLTRRAIMRDAPRYVARCRATRRAVSCDAPHDVARCRVTRCAISRRLTRCAKSRDAPRDVARCRAVS